MSAMFCVFHGAEGLKNISRKVHLKALSLKKALINCGYDIPNHPIFDTVRVNSVDADKLIAHLLKAGYNIRKLDQNSVCLSFNEALSSEDLDKIISAFTDFINSNPGDYHPSDVDIPDKLKRQSDFLNHPIFKMHRSETSFMRYLYKLQMKDIGLQNSMIPLGSCTMKLNSAAEMIPVSWPEFNSIHPFAPLDQAKGYQMLFESLSHWLKEVTGFDAISLQPNAGAQGEYSGLLAIKKYLENKGEKQRNICLIPTSAHGTNPASAIMAGMKVCPYFSSN